MRAFFYLRLGGLAQATVMLSRFFLVSSLPLLIHFSVAVLLLSGCSTRSFGRTYGIYAFLLPLESGSWSVSCPSSQRSEVSTLGFALNPELAFLRRRTLWFVG